jgi:hypothetical protein
MTENEKRQQKAMLLLEHQEAKENLAHLREKASQLSNKLWHVRCWLDGSASMGRGDAAINNATIRANVGAYREALNFDLALALMDEIEQAEAIVKELETRKSALGLN